MVHQHPITPPPELVREWCDEVYGTGELTLYEYVATLAAQWGADAELEACCEVIKDHVWFAQPAFRLAELRSTRRPKPPSLKQQALETLETLIHGDSTGLDVGVIRRAIEALPE